MGSHITASVISFCIETAIDLLILPPHTSHMLQPLDMSVFALLKQALAAETDAASDWILAAHNVLSGLQCIFAHERRLYTNKYPKRLENDGFDAAEPINSALKDTSDADSSSFAAFYTTSDKRSRFNQDPSGLECLDSFDSVWQEDEQVESARRALLKGTAMASSSSRQLRRWTLNCS